MDKFVIQGGCGLNGTVEIEGAKNAALPIIVASLLTDERVVLKNVPRLRDISIMIDLIKSIGGKIEWRDGHTLLKESGEVKSEVLDKSASNIRYSLLLLGALLAKYGHAKVPLPGGCNIGTRRFDMHLDGLRKLGATIEEKDGYFIANTVSLQGNEIKFYYPTFSGTQNISIAASLSEGETVIRNAAVNPEVENFYHFLEKMGVQVEGIGTRLIKIKGVKKLNGCEFRLMPDRIVTATFIVATAITKGSTLIKGSSLSYLNVEVEKLRMCGVSIAETISGIEVRCSARVKAIDIETSAYPGFHTDNQPLFSTLMTIAKGRSTIKETIVENRFNHLEKMKKMGASVQIVNSNILCVNGKMGKIARIEGVNELYGAKVRANDLRDGAALVIAGLRAKGKTLVTNISQIDRGYENLEQKLGRLGANIKRVQTDEFEQI